MSIDGAFVSLAITFALHATIAASLVWLCLRFVREPRARERAWKAGLLVPWASTAFQFLSGHVPPLAWYLPVSAPTAAASGSAATSATVASPAVAAGMIHWSELLFGLWALGASYGLWRWGMSWWQTRRRLSDRSEVIDDVAVDALVELSRRAELRGRVRLSVSERIDTPLAWGRREIILSRHALERLSPPQLASVLAHELAHLERRDPLWFRVFAGLEALTFFSPATWWAGRAQRGAAELAADDWARRLTGSGEALAGALAEMAAFEGVAPGVQVSAMSAAGGELVRRVERLWAPAPVRRDDGRSAVFSFGAGLGLLGALSLAAPGVKAAAPPSAETDAPHSEAASSFAGAFVSVEGGPRVVVVGQGSREHGHRRRVVEMRVPRVHVPEIRIPEIHIPELDIEFDDGDFALELHGALGREIAEEIEAELEAAASEIEAETEAISEELEAEGLRWHLAHARAHARAQAERARAAADQVRARARAQAERARDRAERARDRAERDRARAQAERAREQAAEDDARDRAPTQSL